MYKKVSIIIPYYKKFNYLKKTINSVLNQTYKNFEILLIYDDDDKSDLHKIKKTILKNKKIKLIINKKNIGAGVSRNIGIKYSSGYYVAFLDADDLWKKNKLSSQINIMEKKNLDFTHTNYYIINKNNKMLGKIKTKKLLEYKDLLKSCDIGLSTVILKKKILKNLKFNNFKTKEDFCLWLKISKKGTKIVGINQELSYWRITPNSLSSSIYQKIFDAFRVYNYEENLNILDSCFKVIVLSFNALKKKILSKGY